MDRSTLIVALSSIILGTFMVVSIAYVIADAVKKRGRPELEPGTTDLLRRLEARMDRIEQGVDAVAVEVERIAEGQRFTTKLLSERPHDHVSS